VTGHTATLISGSQCGSNCGKVLVVGGKNSSGTVLASAQLYDPAADSWTNAASLATADARTDHTANLLSNGKVLIAGGMNASGGRIATARLYDPASDRWSSTSTPMSVASYDHTATLLSNDQTQSGRDTDKVLVAGGCCNASGGSLFGSELFDPAVGEEDWESTGLGFVNSHRSHTATLLSGSSPAQCGPRCGMVLVVGGRGGASPLSSSAVAPELYDPRSQRWVPAGDQTIRRWAHTATPLEDGKVLIAGGTNASSSALSSAELYDPLTGVFSATASLPASGVQTPRAEHTAVRLTDGRVLVAAGRDAGGTALNTSALYNAGMLFTPASWTGVPDPMSESRAGSGSSEGPTATLLDGAACQNSAPPSYCGKVLVVGGTTSTTIELFTP
jgi:hypothetical protein